MTFGRSRRHHRLYPDDDYLCRLYDIWPVRDSAIQLTCCKYFTKIVIIFLIARKMHIYFIFPKDEIIKLIFFVYLDHW